MHELLREGQVVGGRFSAAAKYDSQTPCTGFDQLLSGHPCIGGRQSAQGDPEGTVLYAQLYGSLYVWSEKSLLQDLHHYQLSITRQTGHFSDCDRAILLQY